MGRSTPPRPRPAGFTAGPSPPPPAPPPRGGERGVRDHLLSAIEHWVPAVGIDGYRCDVAGMVPADFWSEARERLLRLKTDHFMLAEWDDPAVHETAFHGTYDWELYRRMVAAVHGRTPCADLATLVERRHALFPSNAQPLRFVENHDE